MQSQNINMHGHTDEFKKKVMWKKQCIWKHIDIVKKHHHARISKNKLAKRRTS
jgi:ABC-type Fe3+-citrate transport system substrate-binding protein